MTITAEKITNKAIVSVEDVGIPAGYKLTESGLIPKDWNICLLRDLIDDLEAGVSVNSIESSLQACSHNLSILKTSAVSNGTFLSYECKKIHPKDIHRAKLNPRAETIVISRMNTPDLVGECGYIQQDYPYLFLPDRLWMTRFYKNSNVNAQWLNYLLNSIKFKKRIKASATGTSGSMKNISKGSLLQISIPYPDKDEQQAIAAALSDIDSLITNLDQLIAKKFDIKQAAMQQLLTGKQRLSGFSGKWDNIQLGSLGHCLRGVSYKGETDLSPTDKDHTIRLFRSNNIHDSKIVKNNLQYVTRVKVSDQQVMCNNDILICMANGSKELVGKAGLLTTNDAYKYTFGAFMGCFRTNLEKVDPRYIFCLLQSKHYRNNISNLLAGSSINNLKPSDIESIEFFIPVLEEQIAIANVLSDMDAEITSLEQQLDKTRNLKQGMMQELLTGRIRLV